MVRPPDKYDDDNFLGRLLDQDEHDFREQYREQYEELSDDEARRAIEEEFRSIHRPKYEVFKAVKNCFHPRNEEGYASEYEVSFTNPLYEVRENPADLLLTYTDWRNVNFCFVVCEAVGENYARWPAHVNEIHDLVRGHQSHLLKQVDEDNKEINAIQYVTATRKQDVPDIDFRHIDQQAPENYSLWVVDDDYPRDDPSDPPVELRQEYGVIEHQKLRTVIEDGVDYENARNRDVMLSLKTHPIIALQETLMSLITTQYGDPAEEEPREFNRHDFEQMYVDLCEIGSSGEEKRAVLRQKADELIELAEDADILYAAEHRRIKTNRDFRVRYPASGTADLKQTIHEKYVNYRGPYRRGKRAYEETRTSFESKGGMETDFESAEWESDHH